MDLKDEQFDVYTTIEDAKNEIQRRWNDEVLRKKVEQYLGNDIPEVFLNEPRAVLFRNVISPDLEFLHFLECAKKVGLKPLGLEYVEDHFCTRNSDKLVLCKLNIFNGRDKNGNAIVSYEKIVDLMSQDNKKFSEVKLRDGQNLIEFHRDLLKKSEGNDLEIFDMSSWIENNGQKAIEYYKKFLAFFICHGVLFENFMESGEEDEFTREVFMPAFKLVKENFGLKPIILEAIPNEFIEDKYWWCYPEINKK